MAQWKNDFAILLVYYSKVKYLYYELYNLGKTKYVLNKLLFKSYHFTRNPSIVGTLRKSIKYPLMLRKFINQTNNFIYKYLD